MSEINNSEAVQQVSESPQQSPAESLPESLRNTEPLSESTQGVSSPSQPTPIPLPATPNTSERRDNVIDMNSLLRSLFQTVTNTTSLYNEMKYPKIDEEDSNTNNDDSNAVQEEPNTSESHQHTNTHREDNSKTCCDHSRPCNEEDEHEEDEQDEHDEDDEDDEEEDEDDSQDEDDDSQDDEEPFRADSDFRWKTLGDLVDSHNRLSQAFLQMVQKHN